MPELTNPKTGQTATFTESQARWYRNHGWTDKPAPKAPKPPKVEAEPKPESTEI